MWLLAVGGLMCSAIGIVMVGFLGIVALLRRGWRAALITVSVPATVYVAWLLAVGRHALLADTTVNAQTLLAIPDFAWAGLTATIDQTTGLVGAGAIAILGLTAWMILRRREAMAQSIAFAGAIAAAGFFLLDGIGRAAEGIAAASASRDLYVEAALLLPIAAVVMSRLAQRARVQQLVLLGLTGFALVHGVNVLFDQTRMLGPIKQQEEQQILAGAALIRGGATVIGTHPDVRWASDLTTRDLAFMVREGSVPTDVGVSSANRLNARLALQVVAGSPPLVDHTSTVMLSMNCQGTATLGADGCVTTTAEGAVGVTLRFAGDGWVSVRSSAGGALVARLAASDAISDSLTLDRLAPGTTDYISDTTPADQLLLLLPPGTTTLCGDIQLQSP
ncbi:MAG: hypothetical protein E6J45_11340 [Chloroflexi bacterium]|nr:MAG: hypothetical protein E6J45_11340 [Chloroflexota bacterium]